jgi:hypothetical protein
MDCQGSCELWGVSIANHTAHLAGACNTLTLASKALDGQAVFKRPWSASAAVVYCSVTWRVEGSSSSSTRIHGAPIGAHLGRL